MAPRRGHHGHGHGHEVQVQGYHVDNNNDAGVAVDNHHHQQQQPHNRNRHHHHNGNMVRCCVPTGECLRGASETPQIDLSDLHDVVKILCNNDHCTVGQYMHRECFEQWEQTVLTYLKTCGRARSWSERQRHQNLWTKKGYDLAFKACGCLCGRGHLKKDLDWTPPPSLAQGVGAAPGDDNNNQPGGAAPVDAGKKKKRRNRQNTRPVLAVSAHPGHHNNNNSNKTEAQLIGVAGDAARGRAGSLSSSNGSASPPVTSEASAASVSPAHSGTAGKKKSKNEFFSDRSKAGTGSNGIFSRRQDFSSFNSLPRHKLNSYHIKMEDEGNHGNDETRCFILSTLAAVHASRVTCLLCQDSLPVFDRYPLLDGTFFLSPRQHATFCLEVKVEGRTQFLSAVCMSCLEGWPPGGLITCMYCFTPWDGSSLVLGTMYSYDIFAASHCCVDRSRCTNCQRPLLLGHQRLNFFSDYSHAVPCPSCRAVDTHFVKPLALCFTRDTPVG